VETLIAIFGEVVERAIRGRELRDVDTRLAALDLLVAAHMWALHGRLLRSHLDLDTFTRQQTRVLFEGLLPSSSRARGEQASVKRSAALRSSRRQNHRAS
jgi:hypothetical protein